MYFAYECHWSTVNVFSMNINKVFVKRGIPHTVCVLFIVCFGMQTACKYRVYSLMIIVLYHLVAAKIKQFLNEMTKQIKTRRVAGK